MPIVNTTVVETYLKKAIEANVAYGDLNQEMNTDANKYMKELTRVDDDGEIKLSTQQAKTFAGVTEKTNDDGSFVRDNYGNIQYEFIKNKGYSIIETYKDPNTGYSGTLLKNNETGELILANRGTELPSIEDLGDDITLYNKSIMQLAVTQENDIIARVKIGSDVEYLLKSCYNIIPERNSPCQEN